MKYQPKQLRQLCSLTISFQQYTFLSLFFLMRYISELCPAGTYLPVNRTYCMHCEGNTISTEGSSSCTPCETRTVANEEKTECGNSKSIQISKTYFAPLIDRIDLNPYWQLSDFSNLTPYLLIKLILLTDDIPDETLYSLLTDINGSNHFSLHIEHNALLTTHWQQRFTRFIN